MENNQYKGFAYVSTESKPTILYGNSVEDILRKINAYNQARVEDMKFKNCNIGQLDMASGKYRDYHKYDISSGIDISNKYLQIPSLSKDEFRKIITDLKAAGARYNPYMKKWYISADQDLQQFENICNQFANKEQGKDTEEAENVIDLDATQEQSVSEENVPQIEGVDVQYAVRMDNQKTVMVPASELGINPTDITVGELINKLGEKVAEQIQNDPDTAVRESVYSISVSKDNYDNRCTVYFNDGRDPINLMGDAYGLHFPTMAADEVAEFVSDYMKKLEYPELSISKEYSVGDQIDCYVPMKTQIDPGQPIYVENIEHISGMVEHVEKENPGRLSADLEENRDIYQKTVYEIKDQDGNMHIVDAADIYTPEQVHVLQRAVADELTPKQFDLLGDRHLSAAQMEEIRFGFKDGLLPEQVALYAHPDLTPAEMDMCRIGLQKGLGFAEIRDLLRETKELSWIDSRNRLNEVIGEHQKSKLMEKGQAEGKETTVDFYGMQIEVDKELGLKVITQDVIDNLLAQDIENPDFSNCYISGVEFKRGFYMKELSGASFENSRLYNCKFDDIEQRESNFKNASLYDTSFDNSIIKTGNFEKTLIAHCVFKNADILENNFSEARFKHSRIQNCALETNDFNKVLLDATEVYPDCDVAADQKNLDTITYTMGGAREDEVATYRARTEWQLSGSEISYKRKEELSYLFQNESNDPESQEWREELTNAEERLVSKWDADMARVEKQLFKDVYKAAEKAEVRMNNLKNGKKSVVGLLNEKKTMVTEEKANSEHEEKSKNKEDYIAK